MKESCSLGVDQLTDKRGKNANTYSKSESISVYLQAPKMQTTKFMNAKPYSGGQIFRYFRYKVGLEDW